MKLVVAVVAALSVCTAHVIKDVSRADAAEDRYIYFPGDGDGKLHLVDLEEPVDEVAIADYMRNPDNNGYWLYTRANPTSEQVLRIGDEDSVRNSYFDSTKEVVVLAHGWNGGGTNTMSRALTQAFLQNGDVNVIVLDWSRLANRNYVTARNGVPAVGDGLGRFLVWLNTFGASYDKMHLVGFSLGGHLVGSAGRVTNAQVRRITALDPAGPLWGRNSERLVGTDAQYVEVIHTNTGTYGFSDPCGHVDHYPNGGNSMPGCWVSSCSHSKAHEYMAATVRYDHLHGNWCNTVRDATRDRCDGGLFPMGNADITKNGSGIFRVNTGRNYPF